jgi:hypothetical protein
MALDKPKVIKAADKPRIRPVVVRKLLLDEKARLGRRIAEINHQLRGQYGKDNGVA